jgi:putative oligomerization/nucleic acid binding protein
VRSLNPVAYIRQLGLHPEDSYGFVPMKLSGGASLLYLYRDRPEYEKKRPSIAPPTEAMQYGPIDFLGTSEDVEFAPPSTPTGELGDIVAQAQELQKMYGGGQGAPLPAPGDPVPTVDPERLARLAQLRASGAIDDEEYARLRAEEGVPDDVFAQSGPPEPTTAGGAQIVAHRIYPGLGRRSSTRQLDHFLPIYLKTVGLRPEDTYGVFPWQTQMSSASAANTNSTEWDDYWIVYRDRPEYAAAREQYASDADGKGRWPPPLTGPGLGEAPPASVQGELEVEKERWPRKALVLKQTGTELADSLREKIANWGYEPEDSYGFCPNFPHSSIYFGWRKR